MDSCCGANDLHAVRGVHKRGPSLAKLVIYFHIPHVNVFREEMEASGRKAERLDAPKAQRQFLASSAICTVDEKINVSNVSLLSRLAQYKSRKMHRALAKLLFETSSAHALSFLMVNLTCIHM